jgi:hypothetical protein
VLDVELDAVVEETETKLTNATSSNNSTTNPNSNPVESESTSNNDDLHVEMEGKTNASMLEANETSDYHCATIDIDEDAMAIDLLFCWTTKKRRTMMR